MIGWRDMKKVLAGMLIVLIANVLGCILGEKIGASKTTIQYIVDDPDWPDP